MLRNKLPKRVRAPFMVADLVFSDILSSSQVA